MMMVVVVVVVVVMAAATAALCVGAEYAMAGWVWPPAYGIYRW
jgi:hypothetical protein